MGKPQGSIAAAPSTVGDWSDQISGEPMVARHRWDLSDTAQVKTASFDPATAFGCFQAICHEAFHPCQICPSGANDLSPPDALPSESHLDPSDTTSHWRID